MLAYPITGARGIDLVVVISNIDGEPHVRSIHTTRRQNDTRSINLKIAVEVKRASPRQLQLAG